MKKFKMPRPEETTIWGNVNDPRIEPALEKILAHVENNIFEFKPDPDWSLVQIGPVINSIIRVYGWTVCKRWSTTGELYWVIKPSSI